MRRRDLVAGAAAAAANAAGQQPESETLYIPKAHRVEELALLHDTMDEYSFVELVTARPTLRITHLPVWLDRAAGAYGTVYGHVARSNPQSAALDGRTSATAVFRGPHSYISPAWYGRRDGVPTWNFAVVHATGRPEAVTAEAEVHGLLAKLVAKFEARYGDGSYDFGALPAASIRGMMGGIVAFKMRIDSLEGKFKLGQERGEAEKAGILDHLDGAAREPSMREFTLRFYRRASRAR